MDQFDLNTPLALHLLERLKRGEAERVRRATAEDLHGFEATASKCHDNVDLWCAENPDHRPLRGWAVSSTLFDKHSVVDCGADGLLDITPLRDRSHTDFLRHLGNQEEFDRMPHQVVAVDSNP